MQTTIALQHDTYDPVIVNIWELGLPPIPNWLVISSEEGHFQDVMIHFDETHLVLETVDADGNEVFILLADMEE